MTKLKPRCIEVYNWIERRLGLAKPIVEAAEHPIPASSASWWYVFGSAAAVLLGLQVVTGILLALARIAGETAPLIFTAFGNMYWPRNLTEPIAALPLQIFAYAISPYDDWHRQAWAGALVLLLLVLAINVGVRFLTRDRFQNKI